MIHLHTVATACLAIATSRNYPGNKCSNWNTVKDSQPNRHMESQRMHTKVKWLIHCRGTRSHASGIESANHVESLNQKNSTTEINMIHRVASPKSHATGWLNLVDTNCPYSFHGRAHCNCTAVTDISMTWRAGDGSRMLSLSKSRKPNTHLWWPKSNTC